MGHCADGQVPAAVSSCAPPKTLTRRRDFQRANRASRVATAGFVLQAMKRPEGEADGIRVGFTCSKKVGNAVARNRAKRRLREIARLTLPSLAQCGYDYIFIGRRDITATLPFAQLQSDLAQALSVLHGRSA